MAIDRHQPPFLSSFLVFLSIFLPELVNSQAILSYEEQESVYRVLEGINSDMPWRSLFPDDLCSSPPHGILCDYFDDESRNKSLHVTELSLGYVSEYSPNPPCNPTANISSSISNLQYLRKLFFYRCFLTTPVYFPSTSFGTSLEELVFIQNPSLVGRLAGFIGTYPRLRRLILTGTGVYGEIPEAIGLISGLQELTLSCNRLIGSIPASIGKLQNLRILDLNENGLEGNVPGSIRGLSSLLKLDLHSNLLGGIIPQDIKGLQMLEFLDLSYNRFRNSGIPLFLGEMPCLREVYLSGNRLGGQIPAEIWEKLEGMLRIGLSGMGLVGTIPPSMGLFLRYLCYLSLDNNMLEGTVPEEFRFLVSVNEMNLENNGLVGRLPFLGEFVSRIGEKLKIAGNPMLCVDEELIISLKHTRNFEHLRKCSESLDPDAAVLHGGCSALHTSNFLFLLGVLLLTLL